MASTRFTIDAVFKAIDKFSAPVARMTTRMDRFRRATTRGLKGIRRNAKRMMRGMRTLALSVGSLIAASTLGLRGLLRPAVAFEHAIAGVNAVTRGAIANEGKLNDIREKALELGGSTVFTSIQVADAMKNLARAGLATKEVLGGIQPILHAAGAEGANISDVSKVIISTMKAFNKEMNLEQTTKTADIFANVAASAKTSIIELAEGVSKFAPVAHTFGFALGDTIAFVAALQDVGIEASMSGTQLKTMMSKLTNLSPIAKKLFKALKIDVREALEAGDAKRVVEEIAEGLDRATSKAQKVQAMTAAFGQRGGLAGMLLAASQGKKSGGLMDLLHAANVTYGGAASEMYKIQQETTKGAFTELSSAWETFRIKVGSGQLPEMKGLADSVAQMLRDPKNIENVAKWINSAASGMKSFWNNNKELLTAIGRMVWSTVKLTAQLIGAAWALMAPMRWMLTQIANSVSWLFDLISQFGIFLNETKLGKMINELLNRMNVPGVGQDRFGAPETTRITHGGETHDVVNPHGLVHIRLDPGLVGDVDGDSEGLQLGFSSGYFAVP